MWPPPEHPKWCFLSGKGNPWKHPSHRNTSRKNHAQVKRTFPNQKMKAWSPKPLGNIRALSSCTGPGSPSARLILRVELFSFGGHGSQLGLRAIEGGPRRVPAHGPHGFHHFRGEIGEATATTTQGGPRCCVAVAGGGGVRMVLVSNRQFDYPHSLNMKG